MASFPPPTIIKSSDFPQENQEFATLLANILNSTLEQLNLVLNKGIDFNNLNQELITFNVVVDSNGIPKNKLEIKTSLKTKIQGTICINATGKSFPTSNPLISFNYSSSSKSIEITHITGLITDVTYSISLILIG